MSVLVEGKAVRARAVRALLHLRFPDRKEEERESAADWLELYRRDILRDLVNEHELYRRQLCLYDEKASDIMGQIKDALDG